MFPEKTKTDIRNQEQETKLLNKTISPRRLREGGGGAAILQELNKNHHIAILRIKFIKPLLTFWQRIFSLNFSTPYI